MKNLLINSAEGLRTQKALSRISLLVLSLLMGGCATNMYQQPPQYTMSAATIQGYEKRFSLFDWYAVSIQSIDEKQVGLVWSTNSKIRVMPGQHLIVAHASFNKGFLGNGPYEAFVELRAKLEPAQNYRVNMEKRGARVFAWIEDVNGGRASPVSSEPYQRAPKNNPPIVYYTKSK